MPYSWHTDPAAVREPIKVGTVAYVRAGTNKKPLSKFPDREANEEIGRASCRERV